MDRFAVATLLVLLLGIWVAPFLSSATSVSAQSSMVPVILPDRYLTTAPTTEPATDPTTNSSNTLRSLIPSPATTNPVESKYKIINGTAGFWRTAQNHDGVWWLLSPEGNPEFLNTVTTVQPYQIGRDKVGPFFTSRDYSGNIPSTPDEDLSHWGERTLQRVREVGFKGLGAWCNPVFHKFDVPMTRDLNVWSWIPYGSRRLYTPGWETLAENAVEKQVVQLRDNKNLVGYYSDNELDWGDGASGPGVYFDDLAKDDPNRLQVLAVIQSVWTKLEDFNRDWNVDVKDWRELENWQRIPHQPGTAYSKLFSAWLNHLAKDYFRITSGLIRKYDPNHLILGVRFKGYAPPEVVRASRGYTDAVSLNYYVADAKLDVAMFDMINTEGQQPLIVSEYSFHALDGRSGNRNTFGFLAQVLDQQARADGYKLFTTRLARVPYIVGADWFQWGDEPPSGRTNDGEDVNFGVVDVDDRAYELLTDAIKETTPQLNDLHGSSCRDDRRDVWRESFATKPVMRIPFLSTLPKINGELSDWSQAYKLNGMRPAQTVGLDRSKLPVPNVYMGWTYEGLYVAFEVFDEDIQGAPAKGFWWSRDCVEMWFSTRPVSAEQNYYDQFSHQFFFVPNDFPQEDGVSGSVGQWHRPGDTLTDSLIPHPLIKTAVRVLPDRYVVEMFLPAATLNGFDPKTQPAMAFNFHARNFQHATDYFWSAPKEMMTQMRPSTWGSIYLDTPPTSPGPQATVTAAPAN